MADPTDLATEREEKELARAIASARSRTLPAPVPGAECRNQCGEAARPGSHFCSKECVEDHEMLQRYLKGRGLR